MLILDRTDAGVMIDRGYVDAVVFLWRRDFGTCGQNAGTHLAFVW